MTVKKKMMMKMMVVVVVVVLMMMRAKTNFKKALVFEKVSRTKKDMDPGSQRSMVSTL